MAEAVVNAIVYPSVENSLEWIAARGKYDKEVEKTCSRPPEITDDTGLPVNAIKSWELKSGSLIVKAACGDKLSSPYIVNFGGDHAVRFTGPGGSEYDWE
jgi:hypothetical protein